MSDLLDKKPLSAEDRAREIEKVIRGYCLQHTCIEGEDEGLPLVDALTPPQSEDISLGESELNYLVDVISGEVIAQLVAYGEQVQRSCVQGSARSYLEQGRSEGYQRGIAEAAALVDQDERRYALAKSIRALAK